MCLRPVTRDPYGVKILRLEQPSIPGQFFSRGLIIRVSGVRVPPPQPIPNPHGFVNLRISPKKNESVGCDWFCPLVFACIRVQPDLVWGYFGGTLEGLAIGAIPPGP